MALSHFIRTLLTFPSLKGLFGPKTDFIHELWLAVIFISKIEFHINHITTVRTDIREKIVNHTK